MDNVAACSFQVHIVEARTAQRHQTDTVPVERIEHRLAEIVVDEGTRIAGSWVLAADGAEGRGVDAQSLKVAVSGLTTVLDGGGRLRCRAKDGEGINDASKERSGHLRGS